MSHHPEEGRVVVATSFSVYVLVCLAFVYLATIVFIF